MRSEVSGVRNSCATVATRSFLQLVEAAQPGDVLQHDGRRRRRRRPPRRPASRAAGRTRSPSGARARGPPRRGRAARTRPCPRARARAPASIAARSGASAASSASGCALATRRAASRPRGSRCSTSPPRREDEHRIGQAVDRRLRRLLRLRAARRASSGGTARDAVGHGVERRVASCAISSSPRDARARREVARADASHRLARGRASGRTAGARASAVDAKPASEQRRAPPPTSRGDGARGRAPRALALAHHRVLVEREDASSARPSHARKRGCELRRSSSAAARAAGCATQPSIRRAVARPSASRSARASLGLAGLGDVAPPATRELVLEAPRRARSTPRMRALGLARDAAKSAALSRRSSASFIRCAASTLR